MQGMPKANSAKGVFSYKSNPLKSAKQSSFSLNNGSPQGAKIDKLRARAYAEKDSQRGKGSV